MQGLLILGGEDKFTLLPIYSLNSLFEYYAFIVLKP